MTIAERLEQKGKQIGRQEEAEKIARMMLEDGYDESAIKKLTGFTVKELNETKEHNH